MTDLVVVIDEDVSVIETTEPSTQVIVESEDLLSVVTTETLGQIVTESPVTNVITVLEQGPAGATTVPTITLGGDVGGSGTSSIVTTIQPKAVTLSKFQDVATGKVLGRTTAGTGPLELLDLSSLSGGSAEAVVTQETNTDSVSLQFGTVVYPLGAGVARAQANDIDKKAVWGLVSDAAVATGLTAGVLTNGLLEGSTAQWDYITGGSGGLIPRASYYLSTSSPGKLMTPGPVPIIGETLWSIKIGVAMTATKLNVDIQQSVKL